MTKVSCPHRTYTFATPAHSCETAHVLAGDPAYLDPEVRPAVAASYGTGREVYLNHNNLRVPYSDQFSLGIRNTFGDWNTEFTLSHIRSKDGVAAFLGNRRDGGLFFAPGTTWGPPWGMNFAPFGTLALINNAL